MSGGVSRRFVLSGLACIGWSQAVLANAPVASLRPRSRESGLLKPYQRPLTELVAKSKVSGEVSAQVADVKTGLVLESHQPTLGLPPASVAKALTATYALSVLGPGHHFKTRVMATAPIVNGRLDGDIILVGDGDPTLDTIALASLARQLREGLGMTEVTGRFLVWAGALPYSRDIDAEQPNQVGYNPAVSGLNLNFNRVHFEWRRASDGYAVTMQARTEAYRPAVTTSRMKVEPRKTPVYTYEDQGAFDQWTVARGALGKGGARWLPVRKPVLYAAEVFQTLTRSNGIILKKAVVVDEMPGGTIEVARHESAPLRIILRDMLKYSTNVTAECVGMAATKARLGSVASIAASAGAMNDWAKETLGMEAPALVDHSGLGGASRMNSRDMVKGLIAARKTLGIKALLKSHPIRDEERKIVKDHPVKVAAKTGTLNFVSGLGGFVDLPDGTELAFAFFAADQTKRDALTKAERERPPGGREYNRRARMLQQRMLARWGVLYSG